MPIFFMRLANLMVEGSMCGSGDFSSAMSSMSKNSAPGMCSLEVLGPGVAAGGRQVHGAVEDDEVRAHRGGGQPVGLDQPFPPVVLHVAIASSFHANATRMRRFSLPFFSILVTATRPISPVR